MSDFVSGGWSLYIAALTIIGLLACLALLLVASRRRVMSDDNTTGHVWDEDLQELNNPLPRWWMWLFVITVLFSAAYLALYPGLGSHAGSLQWSSAGQHQAEMGKAVAAMAPVYAKYGAMNATDLAKDPQAMGMGERLFLNHCAACHSSDGRGSKGFPNLADGDWLWGGAHDIIKESIAKGRNGVMPPMAAALGGPEACATWPTTYSACRALRTIRWQLRWARRSSPCVRAVTARTARATRRWAPPTWPTTSGCTAGGSRPS